MPFDPSQPFELLDAPLRFNPDQPFELIEPPKPEIVDSPSPPVSTSEGLKSSLERGWMALKNVPGTIALASKSDLGDSGGVRYAADRASRGQVMDALLAAGQDPAAQTEAYFRTGPEAVIQQRQAEIAKPVIERMVAAEALPRSEAQQRLQTAQGAKEKFKTWARDPVELTASIILESLPASLAGAAVGSLGGPTGMVAGVGLSSGLSTFSSELFGNAASRGVNIQDTDAVVNWLNSPQFDEDFKSAATKSAVVGAIDSVTAGKAGSFISPAIKQGLRKAAVASGKEVALQAVGGASGEALGSVVAGQPVDPFNVFVEAIAEVGSAPGEVAGNLRKSVRSGLRGRESILRRGAPVADTPSVEPPTTKLEEISSKVVVPPTLPTPSITESVPIGRESVEPPPPPPPPLATTAPTVPLTDAGRVGVEKAQTLSPEQQQTPFANARLAADRPIQEPFSDKHSVSIQVSATEWPANSKQMALESLPEALRNKVDEVSFYQGEAVPTNLGLSVPARVQFTFKNKASAQEAINYFKSGTETQTPQPEPGRPAGDTFIPNMALPAAQPDDGTAGRQTKTTAEAGVAEVGVAEVPKEVVSEFLKVFPDPLNTADMPVTTSKEIRGHQKATLKTLYNDYKATRHDAFVERYNYQLDQARKAAYERNRGIETKTPEAPPNSGRVAGGSEPLTETQPREVISGETGAPVKTAGVPDFVKTWDELSDSAKNRAHADALKSGNTEGFEDFDKITAPGIDWYADGTPMQYDGRKPKPPKTDVSFRETAESIAEKLEGIKSGRKPGDLQLFGVIPAVWDAAVSLAQKVIRAGGTAADAIAAALAHIRANNTEPFEEQKATEFIERVVQPQTQYTEPDENEAEPAGAQTVNIAGRAYEVISKDKLTDEQRKAADAKAQAKFAELNIPGAPDATDDTRAGSTNNNTVFRVVPDGQNHDAAVQALRTHLVEEIQRQHSQGGDPAYVGSLINAINMNFDLGRWQDVVSQSVLESLLDVSVGESSKSGTMLRRFRGISEDVRAVAQNAALRLKWEYAKALDPENYAKGALARVIEGVRKHLTENEITSLALKLVKPEEAAPVIAALRKAVAGDFTSMSDVMKSAQAALMDAGMTEAQARKIVSEAETILSQTIRDGANAAIAQMKSELTPEKKRGAAGRALNEIQKMMLNDLFGYGDLLTRLAKSERWVVPSAKEFEQMREWAKREEQLRTPTADQVAKYGGEPDAVRSIIEAATIDARKELLRKINTQWSQWTKPLQTRWVDALDQEKVKNSNAAFREWVAANLLFKIGFGTRQTWDVGWQMAFSTPIRAVTYAFKGWSNDRASNRDSNLQHSIAEALVDAYSARSKVIIPALHSFKETLKGKGEQKQVEQLISSIGIFDRALLNASKMRSENKRGAANLLEVFALTTRIGRQFAAAVDVLQGVPAETQEIAHQVRNALKEKGLTGEALKIQYDSIMGLLSTYRLESISQGREILELAGEKLTSGSVERAAWHILREKLYHASEQAGLPADDWKKLNKVYRDLIGWNIQETGGIKNVGGFGGLAALTGKATISVLDRIPFLGGPLSVPFTFSNSVGIALNRKLAWSPLGFFPGLFKGSPHWEGETNIQQRRIEAVLGTGIDGILISLIVAGVWKALPAFWPKDEKERDKWVRNGWQPGMVLIPWGNGQEIHVSTRTGPLAFFSPAIAAAAAYNQKIEDRAKKQLVINERAKKQGIKPEQLPDLSMSDWMGIMAGAAYSGLTGGRTASGIVASFTDYGNFNAKKATASIATAITPGLPALNEFGRMAGANINPKLATFWDLLVPMPTSDAQRVNMLGDPMRDENDYRRVFQILSGGNFPFPTSATPAETQAYAALFESDYRPPAINPGRGYNMGGRLRPFTSEELSKYTAARGQMFKRELGALGVNPSGEDIKAAFVRANDAALASVGVAVPVRASARTTGRRTRSVSRFRLGRARRGRSLRLGRRGLRGLRKRRKRLVLR